MGRKGQQNRGENLSGLRADGMRFAIIASRFNNPIPENLVCGARQCLIEHGVNPAEIDVFWVPGALEVPPTVARIARSGAYGNTYDGIICAGCVIKGETDHYQFVASEAMRGVMQIAVESDIAITNAILTVHEEQQAIDRSGDGENNKGREAALAAIEVANLFREIS